MGGCYLLKYNGGDSGIKISVLYWRCSLISVSVIRGSTAYYLYVNVYSVKVIGHTETQTLSPSIKHF